MNRLILLGALVGTLIVLSAADSATAGPRRCGYRYPARRYAVPVYGRAYYRAPVYRYYDVQPYYYRTPYYGYYPGIGIGFGHHGHYGHHFGGHHYGFHGGHYFGGHY